MKKRKSSPVRGEEAALPSLLIWRDEEPIFSWRLVWPTLEDSTSSLRSCMKRAVSIARALAAKPEAILYDEPTTMVDPLMSAHVSDLMRKLKMQLKLTSVVVTHDMALARKVADRVVFLHRARAAYFGPMSRIYDEGQPFIREFLDLDALPNAK